MLRLLLITCLLLFKMLCKASVAPDFSAGIGPSPSLKEQTKSDREVEILESTVDKIFLSLDVQVKNQTKNMNFIAKVELLFNSLDSLPLYVHRNLAANLGATTSLKTIALRQPAAVKPSKRGRAELFLVDRRIDQFYSRVAKFLPELMTLSRPENQTRFGGLRAIEIALSKQSDEMRTETRRALHARLSSQYQLRQYLFSKIQGRSKNF